MKFNSHKILSLLVFSFLFTINNQPNYLLSTLASSEQITNEHSSTSQGGQVLEVGKYHLELVIIPENGGAHLDFYLQTGDNHSSIPDAQIKSDLQLPDGTEKQLDFTYDAQGEHYVAFLPETITGQYQIRIIAEVNGESVNGRFAFEL